MATLNTQGISLYYEVYGNPTNPPVLLLSGLGGSGKSWSTQIDRFATDYYVVVPDHRGTGQSTHARSGHTTVQLATDMASLVEHLAVGPMHVVGASTGGAIAQYMALDHPQTVCTLTMVASFAHFDAFSTREFEVRRKMAAEWDRHTLFSGYALFLFSPKYTREHPDRVMEWIERAAVQPAEPEDREIALKRIDMIMAHDALRRLGEIQQPTLVVCGDHDFCTPLPLSEEIARAIPGSELVVVPDCGHLIEEEKKEEFFQIVSTFIGGHR
ncbi:alpha/beta fold hydrolase [Ktedonosporobacter rubrisoli]|uniref:Alpha/beta fold hydrolase n=1 Tax=Ktedonosporobacter rubrisoli TaxID=2509675 RepID=A0A4P6JMG5_KTERU|nr:alpha/beta fold hydrolase [Ktedonosporobacter rubrisoli]QBD76458.1 alpha/beta fold hydrolase [Ktedonosporobacter rubrisoli]